MRWAGTQNECLESKGLCAGADPNVPGYVTKAACDGAANTPGTFTSTATCAQGSVAWSRCTATHTRYPRSTAMFGASY